ncbi:MAG: thioredoxin-disulfide reductase [Synergistaceae bacterium]|jgi:thioredoxin reductase (NADPH)|nr:thioredoxin-disulfide reductase [Synergistaceae bacterium]
MEQRELVIVGAGPAGMTAAIYGRRAGLDVLLLERGLAGGQVNLTEEIENWPGMPRISGADLGNTFRGHALSLDAEIRAAEVEKIERRGEAKVVVTDKEEIGAEAVILATGAAFHPLGCAGEEEHVGRGVSYCAVCDGPLYADEEIAVVGGGNSAVEEAVSLTNFASKVYLIHRRDEFRAGRAAVDRALSNSKIVPVRNSVVEKIDGEETVEKIFIKNVKTGEGSSLPVTGVFIFVGQTPNDSVFRGLVKATEEGWVLTDENMETSVEGIFAAGDVRHKRLRQIVTAASDGAAAALGAAAYVNEQLHLRSVLLEPESVTAFFYSGADAAQARLSDEAEKIAKEKNKYFPIIDGYKNARMTGKLGVALPSVAELHRGAVVKAAPIASAADIVRALD